MVAIKAHRQPSLIFRQTQLGVNDNEVLTIWPTLALNLECHLFSTNFRKTEHTFMNFTWKFLIMLILEVAYELRKQYNGKFLWRMRIGPINHRTFFQKQQMCCSKFCFLLVQIQDTWVISVRAEMKESS